MRPRSLALVALVAATAGAAAAATPVAPRRAGDLLDLPLGDALAALRLGDAYSDLQVFLRTTTGPRGARREFGHSLLRDFPAEFNVSDACWSAPSSTLSGLGRRCVPRLVVGGVQKSGTSDLHARLAGHPLIFASLYGSKETHVWTRRVFMRPNDVAEGPTGAPAAEWFLHFGDHVANFLDAVAPLEPDGRPRASLLPGSATKEEKGFVTHPTHVDGSASYLWDLVGCLSTNRGRQLRSEHARGLRASGTGTGTGTGTGKGKGGDGDDDDGDDDDGDVFDNNNPCILREFAETPEETLAGELDLVDAAFPGGFFSPYDATATASSGVRRPRPIVALNEACKRMSQVQRCSLSSLALTKAVMPESHFVFLFREPSSRLLSEYNYFGMARSRDFRDNPHAADFHAVVTQSLAFLRECLHLHSNDSLRCWFHFVDDRSSSAVRLQLSVVAIYLRIWLLFYPPHQLHIVPTDDLTANDSLVYTLDQVLERAQLPIQTHFLLDKEWESVRNAWVQHKWNTSPFDLRRAIVNVVRDRMARHGKVLDELGFPVWSKNNNPRGTAATEEDVPRGRNTSPRRAHEGKEGHEAREQERVATEAQFAALLEAEAAVSGEARALRAHSGALNPLVGLAITAQDLAALPRARTTTGAKVDAMFSKTRVLLDEFFAPYNRQFSLMMTGRWRDLDLASASLQDRRFIADMLIIHARWRGRPECACEAPPTKGVCDRCRIESIFAPATWPAWLPK